MSGVSFAQGTDIHTRCTPPGGHFILDANTPIFNYEATISGTTLAYVATLDVFHNGVRKATFLQTVLVPPPSYSFIAPVGMESWGLKAGDTVTFSLRVVSLGLGKLLSQHVIFGDVVEVPRTTEN